MTEQYKVEVKGSGLDISFTLSRQTLHLWDAVAKAIREAIEKDKKRDEKEGRG